MRFITFTICICVGLTALAFSGCKQLDLENSLERFGIEEKPKIPDRLVCVWIDDVRYQPGKPAMRGFGGRLMFYSKGEEKPIKVDGSLSVYVFDDQDDNPAESIPLKEFRTPQEVLPLHYSKSDIGHSYSFFLDWDEVGGPQKVLTLIVRFKDATGKVVVSDAARQTLTGVQQTTGGTIINKTTKTLNVQDLTQEAQTNATQPQQQPATGAVVTAGYFETAPREPTSQQKNATRETIITDTIDLPPSFTRKLITDTPQESTSQESAQPTSNSTGSWDTSVSYQRPVSLAERMNTTAQVVPTQIQNLGRLDANQLTGENATTSNTGVNETTTTTDTQVSYSGQRSTRFLSSRYQALRERLRQPGADLAQSQPAQ